MRRLSQSVALTSRLSSSLRCSPPTPTTITTTTRGFLNTFRAQEREPQPEYPPHHPPSQPADPTRGPDGSMLPTAEERARGFDEYGVEIAPPAPPKEWTDAQEEVYGEGTHQLFRQLYKELSDEMRREATTRPPPPLDGWTVHCEEVANAMRFTRLGPERPAVTPQPNDDAAPPPPPTSAPSPPTETATEQPADNTASTDTNAATATNAAAAAAAVDYEWRVDVLTPIVLEDPPRLNEAMTFLNWFALDVFVTKGDVIVHFNVAANEGGMHMRNVRAYRRSTMPVDVRDASAAGLWAKKQLLYDGPFLMHLELDVQNELYDLMMDYGVNVAFVRWAAEWVTYQEHVLFVKWSLRGMQHVLPKGTRGPESDFLTKDEITFLSRPSEDWLAIKYV